MSEQLSIKQTAEYILSNGDFLILSHANPDGDTLGCAYALCGALQGLGKRAKPLCADVLSHRYDFLKNGLKTEDFEPKTVIAVDVADRKLLGDLERSYGDRIDLAIDHHISHVDFAARKCIEANAAACAQTIYKLIKEMNAPMNGDIAACLYTGISTDSGCFKYASVSPETHLIAAELLAYDFPFYELNYVFFDLKTRSRIELEKKIYESMEFYCDGKCAIVMLTKEQLDSVDPEDTNGISAIPRMIEGVEIGIVIKQRKNGGWKASMRSNAKADVQEICSRFGGGGHAKAAGCSFTDANVEDVKKKLIAEIEKELK